MTKQRSPRHVETPIADVEEIPYDPNKKGPGKMRVQIEFDRSEFERLRSGLPDDDGRVTRFIKRAALERADREAEAKRQSDVQAAD